MKNFNNHEENKTNSVSHEKRQRNLTLFIILILVVIISITTLIVYKTGVHIENEEDVTTTDVSTTTTTATDATTTNISSVITSIISTSTVDTLTTTTTTVSSTIETDTTSTVTTVKTSTTTNITTTSNIITSDDNADDIEVASLVDTYSEDDFIVESVCDTDTNDCEESKDDKDDIDVIDEYIVFKPSTHYVHKSTCRWFDDSCYEISTTDGIEARLCNECNPDIEIISEYVVTNTTESSNNNNGIIGSDGLPHTALNYITEEERIYLCNTVAQEYGCDWISQYDKALVVAVVMNRLADGGWQGSGRANTIYNILTAPYQFDPAYAVPYYRYNVTDSCINAVDYYFENMDSFPHYTSFYGDGSVNYFS